MPVSRTKKSKPKPSRRTGRIARRINRRKKVTPDKAGAGNDAGPFTTTLPELRTIPILEMYSRFEHDWSENIELDSEPLTQEKQLRICELLLPRMIKAKIFVDREWTGNERPSDVLHYLLSLLWKFQRQDKSLDGYISYSAPDKKYFQQEEEFDAQFIGVLPNWEDVRCWISINFLPWMEMEYPALLKPMIILLRYMRNTMHMETWVNGGGLELDMFLEHQMTVADEEGVETDDGFRSLMWAAEYDEGGQAHEWAERVFGNSTRYTRTQLKEQLQYLEHWMEQRLWQYESKNMRAPSEPYLMNICKFMLKMYNFCIQWHGYSIESTSGIWTPIEEKNEMPLEMPSMFKIVWDEQDAMSGHIDDYMQMQSNETGIASPRHLIWLSPKGIKRSNPKNIEFIKAFKQTIINCSYLPGRGNKQIENYLWTTYLLQDLEQKK